MFLFPVISTVVLAVCVSLGGIRASRNLHSEILATIIRCPMRFFDTTPIGRVLNRFSRDIDVVDATLPLNILLFLLVVTPLLTTIIIILYSVPVFVAMIIPLAVIFGIIQVT